MFQPSSGGTGVEISAEDGRELDALGPAPRLRLRGIGDGELSELFLGLRLFEGELSSYAEGRLSDGEVVQSLLEREVPLSVWIDEGELLVVPARFLDAGASYTLAAQGAGTLGKLTISDEVFRRLSLVWPSKITKGGTLIYCADAAADTVLPVEVSSALLGPFACSGRIHAGVGTERIEGARCLSVNVDEARADFVVPPEVVVTNSEDEPELVLEPTPIAVVQNPADAMLEPRACATPLGPACARFAGDELVLEGAPAGAWALRGVSSGHTVESLSLATGGEPVRVHGFEPSTAYQLSAAYFDELGREVSGNIELTSGEPLPHLVINEVLSNPRGVEPASEWVELLNVGTANANVSGWSLEDGGGVTPLPDFELAPGAYALIVAGDFAASSADVVPNASALPIVVERLGKSGLSNGGERLRLLDASRQVVSAVPALAASTQGVSIARREPWAPDVAESFGAHAAPGASPGAPNTLAD